MKKNRIIMIIIYTFLALAFTAFVMVLKLNQYSASLIMDNDGYIISRDIITKNLFDTEVDMNSTYEGVAFQSSDIIYQKMGKFYIGTDKTEINSDFPLFVNNGATVMNLTDEIGLITDNFEIAKSYSGLYVSNGLSYNPDMEQAYRENFNLLSLANGLYINTKPMIVQGSFFVSQTIPVNSIIRFMKNEIRYYSLDNGIFTPNVIQPVNEGTILSIENADYAYYDFLEKLGLYEKVVEKKPEATPTVKATPTSISNLLSGDSVQQDEDGAASSPNDGQAVVMNDLNVDLDKKNNNYKVEHTKSEDVQLTPSAPGKSVSQDNNETLATPIPTPALDQQPLPTPKPAKQAAAALPPEAVPTSPPDPMAPQLPENIPTEMPEEDEKPVIKDWKKPVVTFGDFTTSVYSVLSPGMVVENSEFLYRTGISVNVYKDTKLVMKKTFTVSGDVKVGPLNPDTDFHIEVIMDYVNKYGEKETEAITKADVHTKPLTDLTPIRLNWSNGQIFYNKIQLTNLTIINAVSNAGGTDEVSYIETVQYMNRMEVNVTSQTDSKVTYSLPLGAQDLSNLRMGKSLLYHTAGKIASNTGYDYGFRCYDRFGNQLPMEGSIMGTSHTCKQPPKAGITLIKNEVKNIVLSIAVQNPDESQISDNSLYFCIYDKNNNPVATTITRTDKDGNKIVENEYSESHPINLTGDEILFNDLLDYEVYTIRVFCDYDINDNMGIYQFAQIGESSFTTTPIATLGLAFFTVEIKELKDTNATIEITMDTSRTNTKLVQLINALDISFATTSTKDGTGINVTYYRKGEEPAAEEPPTEDPSEEPSGDPETDPTVNNGKITMKDEELALMKAWDGDSMEDKVTYVFQVDKLTSNTDYTINITPKVRFGSLENAIYRNVDSFFSPNKFKTMKKSPVIDIDAIYASESFIQLYGVSVNDPDGAVISYPVMIYVYDDQQRQIASFKLQSKNKTELIDVQKLNKDKVYTFRFFASEYNNGNDMTTYRKNFELYYSELFEAREYLKITTKEAITGSIEMQQLNSIKKILSMEILAKNITSHNKNTTLYQNYRFSSNSQIRTKFSLDANFGQELYNSFQIGYSYVNNSTIFNFYTVDPDTNPGATAFASLLVDGQTRSSENCRWTDVKFFNNNKTLTGTQKIYIVASTVDNKGGIDCLWGIRFHKAQSTDDQHYYADLQTLVSDIRGELGDTPDYWVRVYEDGIWIDTRRHEWSKNADGSYTLKMYQVASDQSETLVDIKTYLGQDKVCNTDFYYEVEKGRHTYRFELWARVFDYQIQLDKVEFTTEKDIIGIRTADELADVRYGLDKKYYVLNDIVFPSGWNSITSNTANLPFNGELDFRGHTLKYNSTSNLISTIGYYGVLKNMVFTYVDGYGSDVERKGNRMVSSNYGHIQNIMLLRNNKNVAQTYYSDSGAICYTNYESGVIENFVAKTLDNYVGSQTYAVVCALNRGTIRNGYIYGAPMVRTSENNMTIDQYTANILTGGIVAVNRQSGVVENVYSLVDVQTRENKSVNDYAFGLIGLNDGTIRNSFYAGDVTYGGKTWSDYGPAYRNRYSASVAKNVYYYSPLDYGKTSNPKIAKMVLYDAKWYQRIFDRSGSEVSGQFNYGPVESGCYPHVIWPECMPNQEYVSLPKLSEEEQLKILDTEVIEQGDDYAKVVITFQNPNEFPITKINAQWLNTEILSQDKDGQFYRVTARMTLASVTKFYSTYNITSFSYRLGTHGSERLIDFATDVQPIVYAEFYKPITSTTDWAAMKDDYYQNYRLYADLNFQFLDSKISVIPSNALSSTTAASGNGDAFWGKLDGNNHKISFIDAGTYGYVIGKLKGTIKNLTVEDLDISKGTSQFKGFIGRMFEGSVVDNVHIIRMNSVSYEHCGSIAGDVFAATIINSSAHNITIATTADGNFTQFVGGLVGKHRITTNTIYANLIINNSYVDGLNLSVLSAGDCGGAGGLVGYIRASAEISHVYIINSTINTVYKNVGGLIGAVDTYTNSESNVYMLKDYYVDVDITSITERCGGIIGFSTVKNSEVEEHGLVLGNTVTSLTDSLEVGRYYGYTIYPPGKVYSSDSSVLNGLLNNDSSLLTYSSLCNPETYQLDGPLYWDSDFVVNEAELSQGIMPKLSRTDKKSLLPYQNDYYLENNPIQIKSITSKNYSTGELYTIQIEALHPQNITITGATFRGLLPADLGEGVSSVTITDSDGVTTLKYVLRIEGFYDSYYLNGVTYTREGSAEVLTQNMYLNVGIAPQYFEIGSMDEWNTWMSKERYGQLGFNIRITGDLDFTAFSSAANGVIVNHLEGVHSTEGGSLKTIKGINMITQESFIKAAYGNISYLNFENITLKKTKENSPTSVNSYGIIESVTGDLHNVSFTNCRVEAYNSAYTGLVALAYGKNYSVTMSAITVYETFGTAPSKTGAGGLIGKLSGAGGIYDTNATNLVVQGRSYVGGIVGTQENGRYLWNINVDNAVVYATGASYSYIGGIVGYVDSGSLEDIFGYCSVKHAVVVGNSYVGGLSGIGSVAGNRNHTSLDKDKYPNVITQSFVLGTNAYIGGAAGQGVVYRTQVKDCDIFGLYNIGGITGNGAVAFDTCVDSTISTVYDRTSTSDTTNTAFVSNVNSWIADNNAKIAATSDQPRKLVYNEANTVLASLITPARTTTWSNFTGNNNSRVAGISARSISATNCTVANCRIGAYGALSVGGIVARTELDSYNNATYRILACGSQNSEIYGAEDIGGIVGSHLRSYIESCYSNANVTATRYNAGGMAGRIKATSLYSTSETPYISHVFYTGTVTAPTYVAGMAGKMEQDLYNVNPGWLMGGDVVVKEAAGIGSFFVNKQIGDPSGTTKALIYEESSISFNGSSTGAKVYYQNNPTLLLKDDISFATTTDLKTKTTYTDRLLWSSDVGITLSNYSTRYWKYNGLVNGYMPYLSCAPYNNYDMASSIRIGNYQEGYKPDPMDSTKALVDGEGLYVYNYERYDGGIPIPGSGAGVIKARAMLRTVSADLPRVEFYTVDADKLNIEFNKVNENAAFTVEANGVKVADGKVNQRTFTLNYDFKSELSITVTDGADELTFYVYPEDVCRNIMTWKSDYYYVVTNQVDGSNPILQGQYINLYAGHALDVNGNVYNVENGSLLRKVTEIKLEEKPMPLHRFTYENYQLETYKNYTMVDEINRDKLRLYVKNNELSAISSSLAVITDSIILDNYNGSKYCSVLSTEGRIVDMTDNKLSIPKKFVNSDIQYMTSNLDSTDHILLVRYYDGGVAGFNYITGELLDINSPRGVTTTVVDENAPSARSKNASMTNFATLYIDAVSFADNLDAIGWAEVNGSNIIDGDAVSSETGVLNADNTVQMYVESTFVLDDGTIVKLNPDSNSSGTDNASGVVPGEAGASGDFAGTENIDTTNNELAQEVINAISSIQAAIHVLMQEGGTETDLRRIEEQINALRNYGVPESVIEELKTALNNAVVVAKDSESKASDSTSKDKNSKATSDKGKDRSMLEDNSKDFVSSSNKKENKQQNSKQIDKIKYIPVYDTDQSQYVLFSEKDLLTEKDEKLKTVNKKVEESGHMIDNRSRKKAEANKSNDENIYGFILLAIAILGMTALLGSLVVRKGKEAD